MRILVTGVSGLLGINLALEATKQHEVIGVYNRQAVKNTPFAARQADLLDTAAAHALLQETQPDAIIHCAALAYVDQCENDPVLAEQINAVVPGQLAALAAEQGAQFIHVSTDAVFDGVRGGYTEDDAPNPLSVYARTKLAGEQAVAQANPAAIIARVNLIGWSLTGKRGLAEFFYNNLSVGNPVKGFTDVFFGPLLVNDMADIFLAMLDRRLTGLYHVVSSQFMSKYAFGVALAKRFGFDAGLIVPIRVADLGLTAPRSPNLILKTDKLAAALGTPPPTMQAGLECFYELHQAGYPAQLRQMLAKN